MDSERRNNMSKVQRELLKEYKRNRENTIYGKEVDALLFDLPEKKLYQAGTRGFFVRKVFDYIQENKSKDQEYLNSEAFTQIRKWCAISLPLLSELVICLQYYHNQILDQKGGVTTHEKINENLIAANLLRSYINQYVRDTFLSEPSIYIKVQEKIDTILAYTDIGQYMDKTQGTYEFFMSETGSKLVLNAKIESPIPYNILDHIEKEIMKSGVSERYRNFVKQYIKRIYFANTTLFSMFTDLVFDLTKYDGPDKLEIRNFAICHAFVSQFVNDNIDYVIPATVAKNESDIYSDLNNNNITLPLIYFFSQNKNYDIKSLKRIAAKNPNKFFKLIAPYLKTYSIPVAARISGYCISQFHSESKAARMLKDMPNIAIDNKYYEKIRSVETKSEKSKLYNYFSSFNLSNLFNTAYQWLRTIPSTKVPEKQEKFIPSLNQTSFSTPFSSVFINLWMRFFSQTTRMRFDIPLFLMRYIEMLKKTITLLKTAKMA